MTYTEAKKAIKASDKDTVKEVLEEYGEEVLKAGIYLGISPSDIAEAYQGEYDSDVDFAQQLADDLGSVDKNATWPQKCIDWEFAAKELMYDYCEENGHYFRNL